MIKSTISIRQWKGDVYESCCVAAYETRRSEHMSPHWRLTINPSTLTSCQYICDVLWSTPVLKSSRPKISSKPTSILPFHQGKILEVSGNSTEMTTFCFIHCTICGSALDTLEDDGKRRSRISFDNQGWVNEVRDMSSEYEGLVHDGTWPEAYDSRFISQADMEVCDFMFNTFMKLF